MRMMFFLATIVIAAGCVSQAEEGVESLSPGEWFAGLHGPYVGQEPPGEKPEVFAPGIISHGFHELSLTVSPRGNEMFYVMSDRGYLQYTIVRVRQEGDRWLKPEVASFSGEWADRSVCFTPDGTRLLITSKRPRNPEDSTDDNNIWISVKTSDGWSAAVDLGDPINTDGIEADPSMTEDGTLYFRADYEGKQQFAIYSSQLIEGTFQPPQKVQGHFDCGGHGCGRPFVSADGSFMLLQANRPDGLGQNDLYVCYREPDGSFGELISLGEEINSTATDFGGSVSPDGKYLFFSSSRRPEEELYRDKSYDELLEAYRHPQNGYATLFWVEASAIEELRPATQEAK